MQNQVSWQWFLRKEKQYKSVEKRGGERKEIAAQWKFRTADKERESFGDTNDVILYFKDEENQGHSEDSSGEPYQSSSNDKLCEPSGQISHPSIS